MLVGGGVAVGSYVEAEDLGGDFVLEGKDCLESGTLLGAGGLRKRRAVRVAGDICL